MDPGSYDRQAEESDGLAAVLREAGVKVIRNETGVTPDGIIDMNAGWGGPRFQSLWGQAPSEVVGHCMISIWDTSAIRHTELLHRAATVEIMENDPEAVWLTMPFPPPNPNLINPRPMLSAGDFRIMPNKTVLIGIGVPDESYVYDRSKPRSSGDELGAELLRRMLKPYGWSVEVVYFDSHHTYHMDCLMFLVDEGIIGLPDDGKNGLWTPLPDAFADWEIIKIPVEEAHRGICKIEVFGDKQILMPEGNPVTVGQIEKRDYTAVEIPYSEIYDTWHSGIHCSVGAVWREN